MTKNGHVHEGGKVERSHSLGVMPVPSIFFLLNLMIWNPCHSNLVMIPSFLWNANYISLLFLPSVIKGPCLSTLPLARPPAVSASEVGKDDFVTAETTSPSWFSSKGLRVKLGPFSSSTSSTSTASLEAKSLRVVAETKGKGFFDSRDVLLCCCAAEWFQIAKTRQK